MGLKRNDWLIVLSLVILAVGLRMSSWMKLGYQFDWDQENDATVVMKMLWDHKPTLIGPRVASDNGFFVGPYHYYFLLPFFLAMGGNPMSGAALGLLVVALTTLSYYFVGLKLWNRKAGFLAALIYVFSDQIIIWNAMYGPLLAVVGFFLIYRAMEGKIKWTWPAALCGLAATIHLVPISISVFLVTGIVLSKKRPTFRELLQMVLVYSIWFLPILIFDLRHDFLNLGKALELVAGNSGLVWDKMNFWRVWWRSFDVFGVHGAEDWRFVAERILSVFLLIFGWWFVGRDMKLRIFTLIWLITPTVLLYKYKGNLPEYYFSIATAILPLILAGVVSRVNILVVALVTFLAINYFTIRRVPLSVSLTNKLTIVDYLVNQNTDKYFNISYTLPYGDNNGFEYLFMWRKRLPDRSNRGHLYTVVNLPTADKGQVVVTSGPFGLIRR